MFNKLLTTEFSTKRLGAVAGSATRTTYSEYLTSQVGALQPYGDLEFLENNKIGEAFKLITEIIDIKTSDKIVADEIEYVVKSVKVYNFGGHPCMTSLLTKI